MGFYNAERLRFLSIYFFVRKGILFSKKRNHFIAECNALANVNIDDSMSLLLRFLALNKTYIWFPKLF